MAQEEVTPEEFEALASAAGHTLRAGSAAEMAVAHAKLQELARQIRGERGLDAEPSNIFKA